MMAAMMRTALTLACLLVPVLAAAQAPPGIAPGTPYDQARRTLLAEGWQPLQDPDADRCAATDRRCTGRPEMVACSGTGEAPCIFAWRRGDTAIEVITRGEETTVTALRARR
jgi:hypothetical protein